MQNNHEDEQEEFAAELSAAPMTGKETLQASPERSADGTEESGRALGFVALALAIVAYFIYPLILGPAAAIMGFIAWRQGRKALGIWSITLGIIAFFAYLFLVPMVA